MKRSSAWTDWSTIYTVDTHGRGDRSVLLVLFIYVRCRCRCLYLRFKHEAPPRVVVIIVPIIIYYYYHHRQRTYRARNMTKAVGSDDGEFPDDDVKYGLGGSDDDGRTDAPLPTKSAVVAW